MNNKIAPVLFIIVIIVICSCSSYAQEKARVNHIELNTTLDQIKVYVTKSTYPDSMECKSASSWRWGAENKCPNFYISEMLVSRDDETIFIPLSAFADLGNPKDVKVESHSKDGFSVVVIGGDAATSYTARLEFNKSVLVEKIVRHGEFPDEAWEKTKYKFNYE